MINLLGMGSPVNKFELINVELQRNSKTVYVELTGSDVTGDGSEAKPYKTIKHALKDATGTVRYLGIVLGAGQHNHDKLFKLHNIAAGISGVGELHLSGSGSDFAVRLEHAYLVVACAKLVSTQALGSVFSIGTQAALIIMADTETQNALSICSAVYGSNTLVVTGSMTNLDVTPIPLVQGTGIDVDYTGATLTRITAA